MSLSGKVTIITGAARGIGRACAERFAREGAKVVVADIDQARGQETAAVISGNGAETIFVACAPVPRHYRIWRSFECEGLLSVLRRSRF